MRAEFESNLHSTVIGYPSADNSLSNIPEGICVDKVDDLDSFQVIPIIFNRKLYNRLLVLSFYLKVYIAIDIFTCAFWMVFQSELSRFLIALPIFGYCGCKYYHKGLVLIYDIYLVINLFLRCLFMVLNDEDVYISKLITIVILNSIEIVLISLFYIGLIKATKVEKELLRIN